MVELKFYLCNKLHFVLFHVRVGRFNPFCIWGVLPPFIPVECGHGIDFVLASPRVLVFLVFLVFLVPLCSTCSSVPRVRERSSSQFGDRQPRVKKHPKTALKIATHDSWCYLHVGGRWAGLVGLVILFRVVVGFNEIQFSVWAWADDIFLNRWSYVVSGTQTSGWIFFVL